MKIPVSLGGSGGSGSDDCTAKASQVLTPYTAITSESDDEPIYGTMQDYAGTTQSGTSSLDTTNSRVRLSIPNEGRYTTASYIYQTYSNIASLISLTSAKIATGSTVLGVSGSYTGVGTAAAAQVLSGYTFSNASSSGISGSMTNKAGTTTSATASLDSSNSRVRMAVPTTGYYNTSAYLYTSYSSMASLIGLTAAKIKYGETILGITGTWNGYVATTSDIYYAGNQGICGSGTAYYTSGTYNSASWNTSCLELALGRSSGGTTYYAGAVWPNTLNCGAYSTLTVTFNVTTAYTGSTSAYVAVGLYSSKPTSVSDFTDYTNWATNTNVTSTGTGRTVSLNISGVSADRYVGVWIILPSASNVYLTAEVTRVQVS